MTMAVGASMSHSMFDVNNFWLGGDLGRVIVLESFGPRHTERSGIHGILLVALLLARLGFEASHKPWERSLVEQIRASTFFGFRLVATCPPGSTYAIWSLATPPGQVGPDAPNLSLSGHVVALFF